MINSGKHQSIKMSKIVLIVCLILCVLFVVGFVREILNRHEINKQIKSLNKEIIDLDDQNKQLSEIINSLQGNDFIEKEARLKLGLKKPGENVVLIKREKNSSSTFALGDNDQISGNLILNNNKIEEINPVKWWIYFFK